MNGGQTGKKKFAIDSHLHGTADHPFRYGKDVPWQNHVKSLQGRQVKARISFACGLALFLVSIIPAQSEPADVIFRDGNIYTLDRKQPRAEAIAVKDQRIVFVGSDEEATKFKGEKTRVTDLRGHTVVPGLTDSHVHIFGIGEREINLNLEGTNSLADFLSKIKRRVAETPRGKWITGRGWIETFWQPAEFPTRQDLDLISADHPVFLTRVDGHAAIANTAALKLANIDKNTPNPFGGEILKDKKTGEPTGMLLDNAQDLVKIPKPTAAEREQALLRGIERELALGWCEIQNAGSHREDIELIKKGFADGKAKIRFVNAVYGPGREAEDLIRQSGIGFQPMKQASLFDQVNRPHRQDADATLAPAIAAFDHHFTQRTIKVIFDGSLGSRGAALLKPYSDAPDTSGYLTEKPEELRPIFEEALRQGIQIETHAIGDRANRTILDLYETAFKAVPPNERKIKEPRWRVEHAQILDPADLPRFAKLGIIASMQPSHAISDLFFAPKRLGLDRLAGAYAWKSLLDSGAIVCGGSDAPVERGEPMIEFYAAVARKSLKGESEEGWHPEQAVSREQALKMFTLWPAYAAFEENDKGSIEVGKLADFTVLSQDIMTIPEAEILRTRSEMTVIGGEIVYAHWVRNEIEDEQRERQKEEHDNDRH